MNISDGSFVLCVYATRPPMYIYLRYVSGQITFILVFRLLVTSLAPAIEGGTFLVRACVCVEKSRQQKSLSHQAESDRSTADRFHHRESASWFTTLVCFLHDWVCVFFLFQKFLTNFFFGFFCPNQGKTCPHHVEICAIKAQCKHLVVCDSFGRNAVAPLIRSHTGRKGWPWRCDVILPRRHSSDFHRKPFACVWVGGREREGKVRRKKKEKKKPDRRGVWVREKGGAPTPSKTRPLLSG